MKHVLLFLSFITISFGQTINTFAGNGTAGYSGDNGPATQAEINRVVSLVTDPTGNIYMADQNNNRVRKVDIFGTMTTFAGTGTAGFSGDNGGAAQAQLSGPLGVCLDAAGDLYVNDEGNFRVRKITPAGIITTVAGNGVAGSSGDGGPALQASMTIPIRCAVDTAGNLFIVDQGAHKIRKVDTNGIISTYAGTGFAGFSGDGGQAANAAMNNPTAASFDAAGNLYVSDQFNHRIRKITPDGIIQTVAGNGSASFSGDGGPATSASLNFPGSVTFDAAGSMFIVDCANNRIRKVTSGTISTIAGDGNIGYAGDGGPALAAEFNNIFAITIDGLGNLYIGDINNNRIREISGAGAADLPFITNITNAASFQPGMTSGSWVAIFGNNLSPVTRGWAADDFVGNLLPLSLSGISVTIDGLPAYVEYISRNQINVLVPDDATEAVVQVQVTNAVGKSNSVAAPKQSFSPGFFTIGGGYVAALHADYSLIAKPGFIAGVDTKAAKPGEIILLYATGFGPTNPPTPANALVTTAAVLANTVQISIGGQPAPADFAGIVEAGLYQFNVTVPALPDGDAPVSATIGAIESPTGVLITIKN